MSSHLFYLFQSAFTGNRFHLKVATGYKSSWLQHVWIWMQQCILHAVPSVEVNIKRDFVILSDQVCGAPVCVCVEWWVKQLGSSVAKATGVFLFSFWTREGIHLGARSAVLALKSDNKTGFGGSEACGTTMVSEVWGTGAIAFAVLLIWGYV